MRSANAADMPAMVGVLARAFYDDPPMVWMLPDHQSRDRRLRRMFATILQHERDVSAEAACEFLHKGLPRLRRVRGYRRHKDPGRRPVVA